jgi:hypothetical protein
VHSTDTVPAMLTPREAVLNRNAAELAGRGNIEQLNEKGNALAEEGVDLAGGDKMKQKPKKYQGGTGDAGGALGMYRNKLRNAPQWAGAGTGGDPIAGGAPSQPQWGPNVFQPTMPGQGGPIGVKSTPYQGMPGQPGGGPNAFGAGPQRTGLYANRYNALWGGGAPVQPGGGYPTAWSPPSYRPMSGQSPAQPGTWSPPLYHQGGTENVRNPIVSPQPDTKWENFQYSAPKIDLEKLKGHLKEQGLSSSQIDMIAKQIGGLGSGGDMAGAPGGAAAWPEGTMSVAYQEGISDIGYPPFVGPDMEYHGDKGGWTGSFDPQYMTMQRYWRGTGSVDPVTGLGPVLGRAPMRRHTFPGTRHPRGMPALAPSAGILPLKL